MRTILAAALFTVLAHAAHASTWSIDTSHSSAHFKVRHMMVTNVNGTITGVNGTIVLDDKDITKSSVTATLDASTINTNEPKRDDHLRSADFLDVKNHPQIKFVSKTVRKSGSGLVVDGDLTIRGVTKPVSLTVEGPTAEVKDPGGKMRRGLTATTTINRQDFKVSWNKALDAGGVVVGDDVAITLEIELIKDEKASH